MAVRTALDTLHAHPRLAIDSVGRRTGYDPKWVVNEFQRDSAGFLIALGATAGQLDGPLIFLACMAGPAFGLVTWLSGKRHATRQR